MAFCNCGTKGPTRNTLRLDLSVRDTELYIRRFSRNLFAWNLNTEDLLHQQSFGLLNQFRANKVVWIIFNCEDIELGKIEDMQLMPDSIEVDLFKLSRDDDLYFEIGGIDTEWLELDSLDILMLKLGKIRDPWLELKNVNGAKFAIDINEARFKLSSVANP